MEKVKFLILFLLGIFCLLYNILTKGFTLDSEEVKVLLQGQIKTDAQDSIIGVVFDRIISFVFSLNLDNPKTYFRLFGA